MMDFQIALLVIGVLAFTGWYKSGGDFEFYHCIVFFIKILFIAGFAAMFVRKFNQKFDSK